MTAYLVIRNWDNFQHYKDRNPPWIKNYTELLSDDVYLGLSGHRRSILHGLWLEYARSHCRLPLDTRLLTRRLNLKVTTADIEALNDAGYIECSASKPLANRYENARPETDREAEAEAEADGERPPSVNYQPEPEPEPEANYDDNGAGPGAGDDEHAGGGETTGSDFQRLNPHAFLEELLPT